MENSARNVAILISAIVAGSLIFVFDEVLLGTMIVGWTMFFWGLSGYKDQEVTADARGLSPKDVKEYRRQHPGTTIVDAVNALGQPKS